MSEAGAALRFEVPGRRIAVLLGDSEQLFDRVAACSWAYRARSRHDLDDPVSRTLGQASNPASSIPTSAWSRRNRFSGDSWSPSTRSDSVEDDEPGDRIRRGYQSRDAALAGFVVPLSAADSRGAAGLALGRRALGRSTRTGLALEHGHRIRGSTACSTASAWPAWNDTLAVQDG